MFKWLMGVKDGIFITIMTAFIGIFVGYIWLTKDIQKTSRKKSKHYSYVGYY